MKKIELKYRKLLRKIFGGVSLTAMAFVFQACYGVYHDEFYDVRLTGTVKSKTTNAPIKGIKITVNEGVNNEMSYNYGFTNEKGEFDFYASVPSEDYYNIKDSVHIIYTPDSVRVQFLDVDGIENDLFEDKTIIIDPAHRNEVKIFVELEEKQVRL